MGSLYVLLGLAIGLSSLVVDAQMLPISLPGLTGGGLGMPSGLAIISGTIIGFLVLANSYLVAEMVGALVDIARNTKKR